MASKADNIAGALLGGRASGAACYDAAQGRWYSYGELRQAAERWAEALGCPRKALVFCFCENTVESVAAYLGSQLAGHAAVLLDSRMDAAFREHLVELYRPDFIVGPGGRRAGAAGEREIHPDLAVLLSTSGSTGSPKLVRLSARNVIANARQIVEALCIDERERAAAVLPLHYSYGLSVLHSHLLAGASLVLTGESLTSAAFWDCVRDLRCTSLAGVPYMYQVLKRLNLDSLGVTELKTLTQAGGRLHPNVVTEFHHVMARRGGRLYVMYGQTEATARMAVLPPDALPVKNSGVGYAVRGGAFKIDGCGEIVYKGPNVMMGYATGPEDLSRGDDLGGILHTGDLGRVDADGCLYVTGRQNRFCKLYGYRINLDEVEAMLKAHGPAAALGGEERLMIYCENGSEQEFSAYGRMLADKLNIHPSAFRFRKVDRLPLTSSGKPDYRVLESA